MKKGDTLYHFKQTREACAEKRYVLHLYIAGSSLRSQQAVARVKRICEESLSDKCELNIVDIFQQPFLAKTDQIIAVPALVKKLPEPARVFVGDMSDSDTILACLTS